MPSLPSLTLASWNLRALQLAGFTPWPDQRPLDKREYGVKTAFLVDRIRRFEPDILGIQEVAQEEAFDELQAELAEPLAHKALGEKGSGSGLRVGVLSRYPISRVDSHVDIPPEGQIRLGPDSDAIGTRFRRPVLAVQVDVEGTPLTVVVVHLKAKRPDYFKSEDPGRHGEAEPVVMSRAMGRSLVVRACEAAGLRALMRQLQLQSKGPVVLMGDFNDGPHSVTTQILGRRPPPQGRELRVDEFYSTLELHLTKPHAREIYSHVWEGKYEVLDHIVVSGDLARRFHDLRCYNDFLGDASTDLTVTDHGALVVRLHASS
jgi:endonuclease/exonuclease/phosphatase family metal-dependent hydrolase